VVADAKYADLREEAPRQVFFAFMEGSAVGAFTMYVRTAQPADRMFSEVRRAVAAIDPAVPVHTLRTLEQQVDQSLGRERLLSATTTAFGAIATLLAVVGLYGVMSYAVSRRTREIGVRVALGARGRDIRWLLLRDALRVVVAGIALGVPAAWWLGQSVAAQLYGVEPTDVPTFAGAGLLLGATTLVAGLVPSIRAARIEVTTALRHE
jgi:ABC-type antimicrobial peptide transport system permease subunit